METKEIIIFAVAISAALGFRFYREYKKKQEKAGQSTPKKDGNTFSSQAGNDDYEPYSGGRK